MRIWFATQAKLTHAPCSAPCRCWAPLVPTTRRLASATRAWVVKCPSPVRHVDDVILSRQPGRPLPRPTGRLFLRAVARRVAAQGRCGPARKVRHPGLVPRAPREGPAPLLWTLGAQRRRRASAAYLGAPAPPALQMGPTTHAGHCPLLAATRSACCPRSAAWGKLALVLRFWWGARCAARARLSAAHARCAPTATCMTRRAVLSFRRRRRLGSEKLHCLL